jgi:hypothetical protein
MSQTPSGFQFIFDTALDAYREKTGKDLPSHPLFAELKKCASADAILTVLRNQIPPSGQPSSRVDKLTKWLNPTVHILYMFSATLGEGVGLVRRTDVQHGSDSARVEGLSTHIILQVFSPGKVVFAGIGILLLVRISNLHRGAIFDAQDYQAAKDVAASQETLIDVFERVENFIRRLKTYDNIPNTEAMTDIIVKIMVQVLTILAIATKEIERGKASE